MKIGFNIKVDVSKLDKARFFSGKKGTYMDLTAFIDTENPGEYGDHGAVRQATSKEEREQKVKMPVVGNVKVFWKEAADDYPEPDNSQFENGETDGSIPF